jgi:hypothetical protein
MCQTRQKPNLSFTICTVVPNHTIFKTQPTLQHQVQVLHWTESSTQHCFTASMHWRISEMSRTYQLKKFHRINTQLVTTYHCNSVCFYSNGTWNTELSWVASTSINSNHITTLYWKNNQLVIFNKRKAIISLMQWYENKVYENIESLHFNSVQNSEQIVTTFSEQIFLNFTQPPTHTHSPTHSPTHSHTSSHKMNGCQDFAKTENLLPLAPYSFRNNSAVFSTKPTNKGNEDINPLQQINYIEGNGICLNYLY